MDGFSDPYVKLKLGAHPKQKTKVVKKSLNPEFNQEFRFPSWGTSEKLVASVWDWNRVSKKVFIGQVVFSHPDQGITNGAFPLVDQKGESVGGTMELTITSEYLQSIEQRVIQERRSSDRRLSGSGVTALNLNTRGNNLKHSSSRDAWELSPESANERKSTTPKSGSSNLSPSLSDAPVLINVDEDRMISPKNGSFRERERDVEKEREKEREEMRLEREKQKERDRTRDREREEDRKRLGEMEQRFARLESEYKTQEGEFKKQTATIESLEKEAAELRQTVNALEAWSNEGKAHSASVGCCSWFIQLFPCCFTPKQRAISKKEIIQLEDNNSEQRTHGNI